MPSHHADHISISSSIPPSSSSDSTSSSGDSVHEQDVSKASGVHRAATSEPQRFATASQSESMNRRSPSLSTTDLRYLDTDFRPIPEPEERDATTTSRPVLKGNGNDISRRSMFNLMYRGSMTRSEIGMSDHLQSRNLRRTEGATITKAQESNEEQWLREDVKAVPDTEASNDELIIDDAAGSFVHNPGSPAFDVGSNAKKKETATLRNRKDRKTSPGYRKREHHSNSHLNHPIGQGLQYLLCAFVIGFLVWLWQSPTEDSNWHKLHDSISPITTDCTLISDLSILSHDLALCSEHLAVAVPNSTFNPSALNWTLQSSPVFATYCTESPSLFADLSLTTLTEDTDMRSAWAQTILVTLSQTSLNTSTTLTALANAKTTIAAAIQAVGHDLRPKSSLWRSFLAKFFSNVDALKAQLQARDNAETCLQPLHSALLQLTKKWERYAGQLAILAKGLSLQSEITEKEKGKEVVKAMCRHLFLAHRGKGEEGMGLVKALKGAGVFNGVVVREMGKVAQYKG